MKENRHRGKHNNRWIYGGFYKHENRTINPIGDSLQEKDLDYLIIKSGFSDWNMPRGIEVFKVIPESVGEYTGLKDKEGKYIYTGDIVHTEGYYPGEGWFDTGEHDYNFEATVVWDEKELTYKCGGYRLSELDEIIIIGNIFENPELIKEEINE